VCTDGEKTGQKAENSQKEIKKRAGKEMKSNSEKGQNEV